MPDVEPTPLPPQVFARASAYTSRQAAELGTPRGLVPYVARELTPSHPTSEAVAAEVLHNAAPLAGISSEPDAPAPPLQGLGPRTRFRFQANDAESPVAPPSNLTRNPSTARRAGAVRKMPKLSAIAQWFSLGAVALAAGAAGFFLGRPPFGEPGDAGARVERAESRLWSLAERKKLDAILVAESLAQPRAMHEQLDQLRAIRPRLAGLLLLEARANALHSYADADASLTRAAEEPGADLVTISQVRAATHGAQRQLSEMRRCLDESIALDPTRAEFHFQRAEVDRRLGRTEDALEGFDRAIALAKTGFAPGRAAIEFRRRLLLIERGRETEIDAQAYQAAFAQPAPPADWLLTAAALALHRNDSEAGARWLRAARAAMPWAEYLERIDDYFFRNHANEPGLKDLFPTRAERSAFHAATPRLLKDP
jgi:tetratricopeptide (TPR) repeat protein